MGSPEVSALVLQKLLKISSDKFNIIAVITQPPSRKGRSAELLPTPVHKIALENNLQILCPETAKNATFLDELKTLEPDLCITVAYGNFLPQQFLDIPKYGTLNIHPSLLPKYRGSAPVQRALECGEKETGVSVAFTVLAMDSGAIIAQEKSLIEENENTGEVLNRLLLQGADLLINKLNDVFNNSIIKIEQNEKIATHTKKIKVEESIIDFNNNALSIHNKVRAFSEWPNTKANFLINNELIEIKILKTKVYKELENIKEIIFKKNCLIIPCADNSALEIYNLQLPAKKIMTAQELWNGYLRNKIIKKA